MRRSAFALIAFVTLLGAVAAAPSGASDQTSARASTFISLWPACACGCRGPHGSVAELNLGQAYLLQLSQDHRVVKRIVLKPGWERGWCPPTDGTEAS